MCKNRLCGDLPDGLYKKCLNEDGSFSHLIGNLQWCGLSHEDGLSQTDLNRCPYLTKNISTNYKGVVRYRCTYGN